MHYVRMALMDIAASPNVFKKAIQLSLLALIPVIGPIFVYGYLFGWARDAAWGVSTPLPESVFSDDGKTVSRGFCALIIAFVINAFVLVAEQLYRGFDIYAHRTILRFGYLSAIHSVLDLVGYALLFAIAVVCMLLFCICALRMSIYSRLTPGFQLGRIAALVRRDPDGFIGLFCAAFLLLLGAALVGLVTSVVFFMLHVGLDLRMFGLGHTAALATSSHVSASLVSAIWAGTGVFYSLLLAIVYLAFALFVSFASIAAAAVLIRATGCWFAQFDVPEWKGQDDPYPFELQV